MKIFRNILELIPGCITIYFYLLLYKPSIKLFKSKTLTDYIVFLFVISNFFNCLIWHLYGGFIFNKQIKFCNLLGTISFTILFYLYLFYKSEKRSINKDIIISIIIIIIIFIIIYCFFEKEDDIGNFGVMTNIIVFLFYTILYHYKLLPIKIVTIYSISCLCWFLYGYLHYDYYMFISNYIGLIVNSMQIIINILTHKEKNKKNFFSNVIVTNDEKNSYNSKRNRKKRFKKVRYGK